jgi:glycosyltransferase involved in cell wall biosynthesis
MNILQLCLSSGLGGLELYVFRASDALKDKHNVIAVLQAESKLDEYFDDHSSIRRIHIERRGGPLPLSNARKLARIIDDNEIDLVHMHWGKDHALAALAKALSKRKPKLVYTRQMMITRYKNDFYHRFLYSQLDLIITITKQLEQLYRKFVADKNLQVRTLYYGVKPPHTILSTTERNALRDDKGFSDDDFVVGLFGRLEDGKGQHLLIKALAMTKKVDRPVKALIVGHEMDEGYRTTLIKLAESLGVIHDITFNDFVDNPQELMQICDCLCLTTYEETFGLVLPEAMRAGIAVIGSEKGGVPEIIDHQQTGLLFKSKDETSLYQQIMYYLDNPETRIRIAENGKQKADTMFDNDEHFKQLEAVLSEAVTL